MDSRSVAILVVASAAIAAGVLWHRSSSVDGLHEGRAASGASEPQQAADTARSPAASVTPSAAQRSPAGAAWVTPSSPSPRYAQPDEIESQLSQFLAQQAGLALVSLSSIECGATYCEVAFAGTEVNPRYVNAYADVQARLFATRWNDFRILSGDLGTREIAPGAREFVLGFEYQPLTDLSPDPLIAARQYAACAAAWRRQTENPTPAEAERRYLEQAERFVVLAASVLGEDEAARVAKGTRGGPLIRECGLSPGTPRDGR